MKDYLVIPLGEIIKQKEYDESKLANILKKFSCQRETDLENFLQNKAIEYEKTNFGKTFLMIDKAKLNDEELEIMAYFTLAQKSVDLSDLSKKKRRKVIGEYPGRDGLKSIPAYLIGQLGRSDTYSSNELSGTTIMNECYHMISLAAQIVGGKLLILECREHMFEKYYKNQGFLKLDDKLSDDGLYTLYKQVDFSEYWSQN